VRLSSEIGSYAGSLSPVSSRGRVLQELAVPDVNQIRSLDRCSDLREVNPPIDHC
jgi:hypothetical protein